MKMGITVQKITISMNSDAGPWRCPLFRGREQALLLLLLALSAFSVLCLAEQYKVIRVVDGDTIIVYYNGKKERVRLLRVDTPEAVHPDKKQNIPMGKIASNYAKERLTGKKVELEFEGARRDWHGRLLVYIFIDGQIFCPQLVREGLSPYYTPYGLSKKQDQEFRIAERFARKNKLNIWGDPKLIEKYLRLKSKWGQKTER